MSQVKVKMNTAAAFQLRDASGKDAGFSSVSKGDEIDMDADEAKKFVRAGYASIVNEKSRN